MSSEIAIKVENLSKCYHIYENPRDRLLQMLLRGNKKYYREFWAVNNLSFEIKKGETVGIVGRNGSGKSTLLQMICGTLNPTSGNIYSYGRIAALLELGSGFNPEFTGRENVYLNAAVLGLSHEEISSKFDEIENFADIGMFIDQPVKTYSSGMMVRLAFSVQAMIDPEILIVDEALAVGDEKFQRKCFARLEDLKSKGSSILFVSHSGPQVIELCDRALLIDQGNIILEANPQEVVRSYQRLIYSPDNEREHVIENIKKNISGRDTVRQESGTDFSSAQNSKPICSDFFDPALTPETTTIYPELGARINSIEIHSLSGNKVNILTPKENYKIILSGEFCRGFEKIHFGLHIKSVSGAVISGQRYPEDGKYISIENPGVFSVSYSFDMNLLPGTYFIGGGIWSTTDSTCLHRILDAIMFRVSSVTSQSSFGYCDLMSSAAEFDFVN